MATSVHTRAEGEERVTPLELFFDLVFVFAITQVTALVADDPTWAGLIRGALVMALLWWAWTAYAWLTNMVDPEAVFVRLVMFGAMAAMLVASLAVPEAFDSYALTFAIAYGLVRIAHLGLYALAGRGDPDLLGAIARLAAGSLAGTALLVVASGLDGPQQAGVWAIAVAVDLAGPLFGRGRGWRLAPGHFAERHALVVIIALGESIVALGVGAAGLDLDTGLILAAVLGVALAAALWWAYFDVVAIVAERHLRAAEGAAQARMARDSYSYLHLPMVAGIVFLSVGIKKTLGDFDEPLSTVPAVALCGGAALYLLAHVAFRLRNVQTLNRQRLVAAIVLVALIPVSRELDSLVMLGLVTAVAAALIAYEAIRFSDARRRVRASVAAEHG